MTITNITQAKFFFYQCFVKVSLSSSWVESALFKHQLMLNSKSVPEGVDSDRSLCNPLQLVYAAVKGGSVLALETRDLGVLRKEEEKTKILRSLFNWLEKVQGI